MTRTVSVECRRRCADRGLSCERPKGRTVQSHKRKGAGHEGEATILCLDVHAKTITVAVAEPDDEVRILGTTPNRAESILKMVKKLGPSDRLRACYEAGPTGYVVYWQLAELGVQCEVVAPTLVPVKAGDRVKTDRRDAEKLARCYRSGDLTAVWSRMRVPRLCAILYVPAKRQAGSDASAASVEQVPFALRSASTIRSEAMDAPLCSWDFRLRPVSHTFTGSPPEYG